MKSSPSTPSLETFWNLKEDDAFKKLSTGENGLSGAEAGTRLNQYGLNTLKARSRSSSFILFLLQFKSPLTLLLIAAALLSAGLGDFTDAIDYTFHYPGKQHTWILAGKRRCQCPHRAVKNGANKMLYCQRR